MIERALAGLWAGARPLLFALDAERVHSASLGAASLGASLGFGATLPKPAPCPVRLAGLALPNPVGLAAGLDKNGAHVDAMAALGFGFIEVGTVTPKPQPGNPKPRLFRLPEHEAIINRLGFNNDGVDALIRNVERARFDGVLGINIGKNAATPIENAVDDYLHCLECTYPRASYITVNLSSPNTLGLRGLQRGDELRRLAGALIERGEQLAGQHGRRVPIFVKVAPDFDDAALEALGAALSASGFDAVIATNTTLDRSNVAGHRHADEAGGLSGAPLFDRATKVLRVLRDRLPTSLPLIGVGGIMRGSDAAAKLAAGAAAVQVYTGLIYRGPALVCEAAAAIAAAKRCVSSEAEAP